MWQIEYKDWDVDAYDKALRVLKDEFRKNPNELRGAIVSAFSEVGGISELVAPLKVLKAQLEQNPDILKTDHHLQLSFSISDWIDSVLNGQFYFLEMKKRGRNGFPPLQTSVS